MFVFSFKLTKAKISLAVFCAVAIVITATAAADAAGKSSVTMRPVSAVTNEDRVEFLTSAGWEIEAEPVEIKEITIPKVFDAVYTEYNNLQKACGYDLSAYKGKTVKRYSYQVNNYPQAGSSYVVADVLVSDGKIIGGDICKTSADGFMHGLSGIDEVREALASMPTE